MKLKLLFLVLTACLVNAQNDTVSQETNQTEIVATYSYDYVVQMVYQIDESKLSSYLVNLLYVKPEENIPTKDAIALFKINTAAINTTSTILETIGRNKDSVFSVAGLEATLKIISLDFTDFYNSLTSSLGISGLTLRSALDALGIDSAAFSSGITFGVPDPFEEFKKGNFTKETLDNACTIASITVEQLFGGVRDIVLGSIEKLSQRDFIQLAISQGATKEKALELWKILNITTENVYNSEFFRNKLNAIDRRLNTNLTLGVVTPMANVTVNRKTYDIWKNDFELISVYGINARNTYHIREIDENSYKNLVILRSVGITPFVTEIEVGAISDHLRNCYYITSENNETVVEPIQNVTKKSDTIEVSLTNATKLILGSSLICENKVYGLARDISSDLKTITLDTFEEVSHSGTISLHQKNIWILALITSVWYVSLS